jgi:hypothetical protein
MPKCRLGISCQGKDRGGSARCGFGGEKLRTAWVKISTAEVLRLRAIKSSVCDRSAKRFAQDDGFVGGWK